MLKCNRKNHKRLEWIMERTLAQYRFCCQAFETSIDSIMGCFLFLYLPCCLFLMDTNLSFYVHSACKDPNNLLPSCDLSQYIYVTQPAQRTLDKTDNVYAVNLHKKAIRWKINVYTFRHSSSRHVTKDKSQINRRL